jgi:hypothetical protein
MVYLKQDSCIYFGIMERSLGNLNQDSRIMEFKFANRKLVAVFNLTFKYLQFQHSMCQVRGE